MSGHIYQLFISTLVVEGALLSGADVMDPMTFSSDHSIPLLVFNLNDIVFSLFCDFRSGPVDIIVKPIVRPKASNLFLFELLDNAAILIECKRKVQGKSLLRKAITDIVQLSSYHERARSLRPIGVFCTADDYEKHILTKIGDICGVRVFTRLRANNSVQVNNFKKFVGKVLIDYSHKYKSTSLGASKPSENNEVSLTPIQPLHPSYSVRTIKERRSICNIYKAQFNLLSKLHESPIYDEVTFHEHEIMMELEKLGLVKKFHEKISYRSRRSGRKYIKYKYGYEITEKGIRYLEKLKEILKLLKCDEQLSNFNSRPMLYCHY